MHLLPLLECIISEISVFIMERTVQCRNHRARVHLVACAVFVVVGLSVSGYGAVPAGLVGGFLPPLGLKHNLTCYCIGCIGVNIL